LLLAFPPLEAAIVMQLMDRVAHTSFFLPAGLVVNGAPAYISGGGRPLLWNICSGSWAPGSFVLILPAFGNCCRNSGQQFAQAALGYKSLVLFRFGDRIPVVIVWAITCG